MDNYHNLDLSIRVERSKSQQPKKVLANTDDIRKNQIQLAFVDVDAQLEELAGIQDLKQVKKFIPKIRNQLYELSSICLYGLNICKFVSHNLGEKTPLNCTECA